MAGTDPFNLKKVLNIQEYTPTRASSVELFESLINLACEYFGLASKETAFSSNSIHLGGRGSPESRYILLSSIIDKSSTGPTGSRTGISVRATITLS